MDYFKKIIFILLLIFNFSIANASTSEFIGVIGAAIGEIKNQKDVKNVETKEKRKVIRI